MNLDDKLLLILQAVGDDFFFEGGEYDKKEYADRIAQIKQVFADEGYINHIENPHLVNIYADSEGYLHPARKGMTGQEWYERFVAELTRNMSDYSDYSDGALEAAKRASGITDDK